MSKRLSGYPALLPRIAAVMFVCVFVVYSGVRITPNTPFKLAFTSLFYPAFAFFGITQDFALFAPDVASENQKIISVLTFKDGSQAIWEFPRMERMTNNQKVQRGGWRKYTEDLLPFDGYYFLWPDACRYLSYRFSRKDCPVVRVSLLRNRIPIKLPNANDKRTDALDVFYSYQVKPEDLLP